MSAIIGISSFVVLYKDITVQGTNAGLMKHHGYLASTLDDHPPESERK